MGPRVTIAVPCYNRAAFLFESLNSLIAQTVPEWEAVVVDDCSTENMISDVVSTFADSRIRYIRHEQNRGPGASRNTALRHGTAPFAVYLDSDDFLHPEFLKETLSVLQNKGCDCAFTDYQLVGVSHDIWGHRVMDPDDLAEVQWLPGAGTVMRRSVWEGVGGYCEADELRTWNEDWDFWIAAMSLGVSASHVPRPLYYYRRHASSLSGLKLPTMEWRSREFILNRHPTFFSVGDRAARFRSGGLQHSAHACRRSGNYWEALQLFAKAVAEKPSLLLSIGRNVSRSAAIRVLRLMRRSASRSKSLAAKVLALGTQRHSTSEEATRGEDWEAAAAGIHYRYGYLSHDYALLDKIIEEVKASSILEIGSGSGRLIPVYLKHFINPILVQNISKQAIDICRRRFHCQRGIQYILGTMESIPTNTKVDLIICTRVLQHILNDDELWRALTRLAPTTNAWFVNEPTREEMTTCRNPYIKGRDYACLFEQLGFRLTEHGYFAAENGTMQFWQLYMKLRTD